MAAITSSKTLNAITYAAGTGNKSITLGCTVTNAAGTMAAGNLVVPDSASAAGVPVLISDATTEDWATIGVTVISIGLIPQGGTAAAAVPVFTAPIPAPVLNLVQLDNLSELLGQFAVPPGTYTGAVLTLAANPGDVVLISAAEPSATFPDAPGSLIARERIQIQGATGDQGSLTVSAVVPFAGGLVLPGGGPVDLEFDLSHPTLVVDHRAAGDAAPIWAVNFNGPVRHNPALSMTQVLRQAPGSGI